MSKNCILPSDFEFTSDSIISGGAIAYWSTFNMVGARARIQAKIKAFIILTSGAPISNLAVTGWNTEAGDVAGRHGFNRVKWLGVSIIMVA